MAESGSKTERGFLVLADISGYTSFLSNAELNHTHEIVSEFIELISRQLQRVSTLVKVEGDAVLTYASESSSERPEFLLEAIEDTYAAFRHRQESINRTRTCTCKACGTTSLLDLKFLVHFGSYVKRSIAGMADLVGPDVIVAHRLLKNSVTERTGWKAYVLMTQQALDAFGFEATGFHEGTESFEHLEPVKTYAYDLHERFSSTTSERSILDTIENPDTAYRVDIVVPAAIAWQWLNDPLKRSQTDNATITVASRPAGRMQEGSVLHCAHGKQVDIEEIVEWRPFRRFALKHQLSIGYMIFVYDIAETPTGAHVEARVKLFPSSRILRPVSTLMMKLIARLVKFDAQLVSVKRLAEEDWSGREPATPASILAPPPRVSESLRPGE